MQWHNIQSFIRGIFEKEGTEARIADEGLLKLLNFDIEITGRLVRRRGYTYWSDLLGNSETSIMSIPDVANKTGFGSRIQSMYYYSDVAGLRQVIVCANGKIYAERNDGGQKIWVCLNPTSAFTFREKERPIDIKIYLDIVFFNDYQNNVFMYNSQAYSKAGRIIAGNRFIYFAGDKIYFRNYSTFSSEYHIDTIIGGDVPTKKFILSGDVVHHFEVGDSVIVRDSSINDRTYTVVSATLNGGNTDVIVSEPVPGGPWDGEMLAQFRIKIEDDPASVNINGDLIEQSLRDINYIAPSGGVITTAANLKLGYCLRVGNETTGFYYYVLDNGRNQRATENKCYLIKMNDSFLAERYIPLDMDILGEVINFDYYNEHFYIWCKKGVIHVLDTDFDDSANIDSGDAIDMEGPTNDAGRKQYSIAVNENGIFLYTDSLPDKDDWYQPLILKQSNLEFGTDTFYSSSPVLWSSNLLGDETYNFILKFAYTESYLNTPPPGTFTANFKYFYSADLYQDGGAKVFVHNFRKNIIDGLFSIDKHAWEWNNWWTANKVKRYTMSYFVQPSWNLTCGGIYNVWGLSRSNWTVTDGVRWFLHAEADLSVGDMIRFDNSYPCPPGLNSWTNYYIIAIYNLSSYVQVMKVSLIPGGVEVKPTGQREQYTFKIAPVTADRRPLSATYSDLATKIKVTHSEKFAYDKILTNPIVDFQIYNNVGNLSLSIKDDAFYLIGSAFNSNIFTDKTTSIYVLLVHLNLDGSMKSTPVDTIDEGRKTFRYMYPLGKTGSGELRNIVPLEIVGSELYCGTSMLDGPAQDNGKYMKLNITSFGYEIKECEKSAQRHLILDDMRWFLKGAADGNFYRVSRTWDWDTGLIVYENFINLGTYYSNLSFNVFKTVSGEEIDLNLEKIQYLGTPRAPFLIMDYDLTSTFKRGTKFKYYMVYKMYSGKTTHLSHSTEEVEIPDMGGIDPQPIKISLSELNLENVYNFFIYEKEDVEEIHIYRARLETGETIWGDPIFVHSIAKDSDGNFLADTWEDNQQDYTYFSFNEAYTFKYPISDMEVHKNRLILINRIDYENPNVIQYSDIDMADAIPPDNIRAIESGDGDVLSAGLSVGDYLYLFKTNKIYAILGDVFDGQLVDVSKTIGAPYKNLITEFNNVIYFLNPSGIFRIAGGQVEDLLSDRVRNYFVRERDDSINFDSLKDNGFASVDKERQEVRFFVAQKVHGIMQEWNNLVIIYNIQYNYFRTYQYFHNIAWEEDIQDVIGNEKKKLMADYLGNIYEVSKDKNDDNNGIKYIMRTKEFNLGTDVFYKHFKMLKVFGKFQPDLRVTYWIDGERKTGNVIYSRDHGGGSTALMKLWRPGFANRLSIEIGGEDLNDVPPSVDEIMIGYSKHGGLR